MIQHAIKLRTDRYSEAYPLRNRLDDGPAWRQAYFNSDRVYYDGAIQNNPVRQWWLRRGRGKRILGRLTNQIPPSSAEFGTFTGGADTTYNVDNCISLLKDMIARYCIDWFASCSCSYVSLWCCWMQLVVQIFTSTISRIGQSHW